MPLPTAARWWRSLAVALVLAVWATATPALAQDEDYAVPDGRVYTQAAGDAPRGRRLPHQRRRRHPLLDRFPGVGPGPTSSATPPASASSGLGFTVQVMQKVVFQWHPATSEVMFINIFDELYRGGFDDELARLLVPPHQTFAEEGLSWNEIIGRRWALPRRQPAAARCLFRTGRPPALVRLADLPRSSTTTA